MNIEDEISTSDSDSSTEDEQQTCKQSRLEMKEDDTEDYDYFKTAEENDISKISRKTAPYVGNLKYCSGYKVLRKGYICVRDTIEGVTLAPNKPEQMVLLRRLRHRSENGGKQQIFLCQKCNTTVKVESLINAIGKDDILTKIDLNKKIVLCEHSKVAYLLYTREEVEAAKNQSLCTKIRNDRHFIAVCFNEQTQTFGVVSCNKA